MIDPDLRRYQRWLANEAFWVSHISGIEGLASPLDGGLNLWSYSGGVGGEKP